MLAEADAVEDAPVVVFAYTIKGCGLPFAGDPLNHSQLLTQTQMDALRVHLGVPEEDIWAAFPPDSPEGLLCAERGAAISAPPTVIAPPLPASAIPESLGATHPAVTSTQEALGRALVRLAEVPEVGERMVTLSPDVATSTHLAGWINKVGVFAPGGVGGLRGGRRSGCCAGSRGRRVATSSSASPR